jgi:hypothetical protein
MVVIPDAQGSRVLEGSSVVTGMGEGTMHPAECFDHGAHEEDGPVTREIPSFPR